MKPTATKKSPHKAAQAKKPLKATNTPSKLEKPTQSSTEASIKEIPVMEHPPLFLEVKSFLASIESKSYLKSNEAKELLELGNKVFNKNETAINCSSCLTRYYNSLKQWYNKIDKDGKPNE